MTKLLLDESVPRNLASAFPSGYEVHTVQQSGWAGTKNGKLLKLVKDNGFSALITADKGISHQQNVESLGVVVIVLLAYRTHIGFLAPLVPQIIELLDSKPENGVHIVGE